MEELNGAFALLVDNAIEMVVIYDNHGKILYSNSICNEELGYIKEELFNQQISDIIPEEIDGTIGSEVMVYRKNKTCFNASYKKIILKSDGSLCGLMLNNDSYKSSLEKTIGKVKLEADSSAKVKSEFVANVTHELRTPVNGILGNTNMLLDCENDPEKLHILHTIETGCKTMNNLINNILDFSKLEAGKFTLEQRKFEFRSMIDYVRSTHLPKITEKGLKFFVTVSPEVPEFIIGDELRIGQVLNNLLSNACKFTHVGKVSLEVLKTAQQGNRIELFFMVVDTGIGINKADMDKLFKSFSQVDASVSRKYGGTGLGLNISRQLVELMGGNISVDSQVNKGTMFSFSIWVELPDDAVEESMGHIDTYVAKSIMDTLSEDTESSNVLSFGTEENMEELRKQLSKIILCIEMENWEKAESFTDSIKHLTVEAPRELRTGTLKLKMAVQKSDYDKSVTAYENVMKLLGDGKVKL